MEKQPILRSQPKAGCHAEFIEALKNHTNSEGQVDHHIMKSEDEVVAVAIRDIYKLEESAKQGVGWLNQ